MSDVIPLRRPTRCPNCAKAVAATAADHPFCSKRCRQIDLARWLGGDYRIPTDEPPDDLEASGEGEIGPGRRPPGA